MILKVDQLSKSYPQAATQVNALRDVSIHVNEGETLAVVGPSGSGKTTLLSLLAGLDSPTDGNIHIKDTDITQLDQRALSGFRGQHIGIIFQQFHLMSHLTALENVALPLEISSDPQALLKAEKALEQVGLSTRATHFPHQLSGGECQRVAIARACVVQPDILLADEPSGNLDTETGRKVMDLIFELVKENNMTLILVTHDTALAARCGRQIQLSGGRLQ